MKTAFAFRTAIAAIAMTVSTGAFAGSKIEKVDIVKEGIDLKAAIVRANSNGYTTYENSSHRYYIRVFAKAKGGNRIWWVKVGPRENPVFEVGAGAFFKQEAGHSEGWGVYKKSLAVDASFEHTQWWGSPKEACIANMKKQMDKGMKKSDVLKKEWKVTAHAILWFNAEADTKSHNKKNKHDLMSSDSGAKSVSYPVNVVCRKGL